MLYRLSSWALDARVAPARWTVAVAGFASAFGLRFALDGDLPPGFPYLTFFPAVILTTFFAGLWPGIAVASASGLAAWYFFIPPFYSFGLTGDTVLALGFYGVIAATDIALIHLMHIALRDLSAERRVSADLAEQRKLMFHELQHRVSNNLATVAGLLKLQRRSIADETARHALEQAVGRINLVSKMQRMLHDPAAQQIDFGRFLAEMAQSMVEATGSTERIALQIAVKPVLVVSDQAIPLGLIATELVSNALEHGFGEHAPGTLSVTFGREGETARLEISDTGAGLPPGFDLATTSSLGISIARQFAQQLDASLTLENRPGGGAVSVLVFPVAGAAG
ncbi:DUF4118 domain-containing protein [Fertoebacter nigrum]|uniref:histidine kinase n=1 Tax=Fertoeibacter niger TaxID=2656921 RepID=A0A8X8GU21_9RHOB|nr:histidine kinase dimerization/phosphoacceptor domain -containing protein [Fertoeibacter niger]NUB43107.1 DUF4118 domain-containing protein [Fertoeibacter niger]